MKDVLSDEWRGDQLIVSRGGESGCAGSSPARERRPGHHDRGRVAVGRGRNERDHDVSDVEHGKTQAEADGNALTLLTSNGATKDQKIVYRYFSYGADSK
jgi:hypothetical protein